MADDLIILVTLACEHDRVGSSGPGQGQIDRLSTIDEYGITARRSLVG